MKRCYFRPSTFVPEPGSGMMPEFTPSSVIFTGRLPENRPTGATGEGITGGRDLQALSAPVIPRQHFPELLNVRDEHSPRGRPGSGRSKDATPINRRGGLAGEAGSPRLSFALARCYRKKMRLHEMGGLVEELMNMKMNV